MLHHTFVSVPSSSTVVQDLWLSILKHVLCATGFIFLKTYSLRLLSRFPVAWRFMKNEHLEHTDLFAPKGHFSPVNYHMDTCNKIKRSPELAPVRVALSEPFPPVCNIPPNTFIICVTLSLKPSSNIIYCFKLSLKPSSSTSLLNSKIMNRLYQPFIT